MFIPSPITTTSHESPSVFSNKSNDYTFFCNISDASEPAISRSTSISSITLDPALTLDNTSVSTEKTASPLIFDHDNIEDNFINPFSKSAKTNVQIIFKSDTEDLNNENIFISVSSKSRFISVQNLFTSSLSESKNSNDELNIDNLRQLYANAIKVNTKGEIERNQQIANLTSESLPENTNQIVSNMHKTFYGISLSLVISGITLVLLNNSSHANENFGLTGLLLILSGITAAIGTSCHQHHAKEREAALQDTYSENNFMV